MKIPEIIQAVSVFKPISRRTCYTFIARLKIRPISKARQHPQIYPANTANRILAHLGFSTPKRKITRAELEQFMADGEKQFQAKHADKMISVRTLRAARPKKQTKGTK